MNLGLVGRKVGMMRTFTDDGVSIPVTVLDVSNNRVSQLKTPEIDGYAAVQLTFGVRRSSRVIKPAAGHLAKAGVAAGSIQKEFKVLPSEIENVKLGDLVPISIFILGQKVDVTANTQGKGFAGTIKRHNFASSRQSHGNSVSHRTPGSIGMAQDPGRVFPGKRMAGHMGNTKRTVQNLEIVRIDVERQLILLKGAVPGSKGAHVVVRPAAKAVRES